MSEYIILQGAPEHLAVSVTNHLREDWTPVGGITIGMDRDQFTCMQAMVRVPPAPTAPDEPPAQTVTIPHGMARALAHLLNPDAKFEDRINSVEVQAALHEVRRQFHNLIVPKGR